MWSGGTRNLTCTQWKSKRTGLQKSKHRPECFNSHSDGLYACSGSSLYAALLTRNSTGIEEPSLVCLRFEVFTTVLLKISVFWDVLPYGVIYKVVQIWPGLFVCKQVTVCPGHIWTTLYIGASISEDISASIFRVQRAPPKCWYPCTGTCGLIQENLNICVYFNYIVDGPG